MVERISYGILALLMLFALFAGDVVIALTLDRPSTTGIIPFDGPIGDLLRRGSILPIAYVVVMLVGAVEMSRLFRARSIRPYTRFAYAMIAVLLLSPWLSAAGWLGNAPNQVEGLFWQIVWLVVALVGTAVLAVLRQDPAETFRDVGATWIMIFYLGFLQSFGVLLRCGQDTPGWDGAWLLLITLLVAKASDIGGYLVGVNWGRHKLIPSVSPGKTVEGTIGGLLASVGCAIVFSLLGGIGGRPPNGSPPSTVLESMTSMMVELTGAFARIMGPDGTSPIVRATVFGVLVSGAALVGDLFESSLKRGAKIKDSGHLLPSFGGILDLVDSPAMAVPVAWLLLSAVWAVV